MVSRKGEDRARLDGFELEIFELVREHATSEQWREWLRVPLEHAAANGNEHLFTRLMDAGAHGGASWRGCHGRTLLGAAAYGKSEEILLTLLKAGGEDEVNVTLGAKKETALHVAAMRGAENASNALMLAGANPCVLDKFFESPLHLADEAGHHGVVNIVLLRGTDLNTRRLIGGQTPLHLAAAEGHSLCVSKLVIGGADQDSRNSNGETPLFLAARYGHLGTVEELLAAAATLDIRMHSSFVHYSALDIAAMHNHVEVVRALLARGSSVSSSHRGHTALHTAADVSGPDRDNGDVVRLLLEAGADINARTSEIDDGFTPLHFAVHHRMGSSGTIRALLEGGANLHARSVVGNTPLHYACYRANVCAVDFLLRWGADETLTSTDGATMEDMFESWEMGNEEDAHDEQRKVDVQRIRHMLARAPADRSWRRRGWLVLFRSFPAKMQFTMAGNSRGGGGGGGGGTSNDAGDGGNAGGETTTDLEQLVCRLVELDVEGVFRSVVGFL